MRTHSRFMLGALLVAASLGAVGVAIAADDYPNRPVHLVVPYPPGSATDTGGRIVADALSKILGQNVVVENRGGASGTVGSAYAARAAADGYTLLLGNSATHGAPPSAFPDLPYSPLESFDPVSTLYVNNLGIAVAKDFPADTFEQFLEYVKANPGTTYAIPGYGTVQQLAANVLIEDAGLEMTVVPYQGGGPAMVDLVGGHVPVAFTSLSSAAEFYRADQIKVVAILGAAEVGGFEGIPSVGATFDGYDYAGWGGLFVPAGTDPAIIEKLNTALATAYEDATVTGALNAVGLEPMHSTPEELTARSQMLLDGWAALEAAGVKISE